MLSNKNIYDDAFKDAVVIHSQRVSSEQTLRCD